MSPGGDEFAVLSTGLREEEALELADRLMDVISQPYHVGELEIKIGTCVGVAISEGEPDTEELFKHADLALYEAKALGPGHASVFKSQMQTRLREKKSFEADLQKALENGEMEVYYQPQACTITREICGYEALLRWTHPIRGQFRRLNLFLWQRRLALFTHSGIGYSRRPVLKLLIGTNRSRSRSTSLLFSFAV